MKRRKDPEGYIGDERYLQQTRLFVVRPSGIGRELPTELFGQILKRVYKSAKPSPQLLKELKKMYNRDTNEK